MITYTVSSYHALLVIQMLLELRIVFTVSNDKYSRVKISSYELDARVIKSYLLMIGAHVEEHFGENTVSEVKR